MVPYLAVPASGEARTEVVQPQTSVDTTLSVGLGPSRKLIAGLTSGLALLRDCRGEGPTPLGREPGRCPFLTPQVH